MMKRQILNAVDAGDGDVIARQLRERMSAEPDNVTIRLELAGHYRAQGYPELALEHYRLAADRFAADARVALLLAQEMHTQAMTEQAADGLAKFLARHSPENSDLPAWLGILRDELKDYAGAESAHRAAMVLNPTSAKLHNNLGYNLLLQGKREDAVDELRKALALEPGMATARNNIALALMRDSGPEDRREALMHWQSVSNPAAAHNNVAAALLEQGYYSEARTELESALGYNRTYAPALKNLALLSRMNGSGATVTLAEKKQSSWKITLKHFWSIVSGVEEKPRSGGVTLAARE